MRREMKALELLEASSLEPGSLASSSVLCISEMEDAHWDLGWLVFGLEE